MGSKHVGFGHQSGGFGTGPVAATIWAEILGEAVRLEPQYQPLNSIRSVSPRALSLGSELARGNFRAIVNYQDAISLVWLMFGDGDTTGAGPYTHNVPDSATPAYVRPTFTVEAQRDVGDGGATHKYADCIMTELAVQVAVNEAAEIAGAVLGGAETLGSPSTPSYPDFDLVVPTDCTVEVDSVAVAVERFQVALSWPADEPSKLGAVGLARKPRDAGELTIRGSFTLLEHDATQYSKFTGHSDLQIELLAALAGAAPETFEVLIPRAKLIQATPALEGRATPKPVYEFEAQLGAVVPYPVLFSSINDKATLP